MVETESGDSESRPQVSATRRLYGRMRGAARGLANFLVPPTCISCARPIAEDHALCGRCWHAMPFLSPPWCARLGRPFAFDLGPEALCPQAIAAPPVFARARSACAFAGPARDLVHSLKYGDRPALARAMGSWMARAGSELLAGQPLLVPVPLHRRRLWQRRYNQAALLAMQVAAQSGVDIRIDALERVRPTKRQVGLSVGEREENVRRAFRLSESGTSTIAGRRVVLIDDVYTTGATVSACAKTLLEEGAASVDVLTFALAHADAPLD